MKVRLKEKQPGQSIPLIALMIVVLFGMVGLSVDVGNTYAEQRSVVRASNAAALAGMNAVIAGQNDSDIATAIKQSLASNGVKVTDPTSAQNDPNARILRALYYGPNGNALVTCNIGQCGAVPQGVSYIQIDLSGTVNTYFARVVGRPTLPVGATAWSARCLPVNGVYPIAVQNSDFDANGFAKPTDTTIPWGNNYTDQNWREPKTWRRIYLKSNGTQPGNFSFLRWNDASGSGNEPTLRAALSGDGTLAEGDYQEAPWGDPNITQPRNYPLAPKVPSIGDWIWGNSGMSWSTGVRDALQAKMDARTVMILPIVDNTGDTGVNAKFHLARLGAFYIRGMSKQAGANAYLDLVYLGNAKDTACLQTNVTPPDTQTQLIRVRGPVSLNPRWQQQSSAQQPIAYQIVLDVSGSMSLDYYGLGTENGTVRTLQDSTGGKDVRCNDWDNTDVPAYVSAYPSDRGCQAGGDGGVWRKYQERRVYKSKDALYSLIDAMDAADTMRIVVFSGGVSGSAKSYPTSGWSRDRGTLKDAVRNAGMYNNDPYRTQGGTPGADGLQEAARSLGQAPTTAPDGRTYKPVVIYLTDGMANYFLDGGINNADDNCGDIQPVSARWVTARCQTKTTASGKLRPIAALIDQANKIKQTYQDKGLALYTIGLAKFDPAGLDQVASAPNMFYPVTDPNGVKSILFQIKGEVAGPCTPAESGYTNVIKPQNWPSPAPDAGDSTVVGYVELYDQNMNPLPSDIFRQPIRHESINGGNVQLAWSLPQGKGLAPGNYIAKAWIYYKGEDGVTRVYDSFLDQSTLKYQQTMAFSVSYKNVLGNELVIDQMYLDLNPANGVCAIS